MELFSFLFAVWDPRWARLLSAILLAGICMTARIQGSEAALAMVGGIIGLGWLTFELICLAKVMLEGEPLKEALADR